MKNGHLETWQVVRWLEKHPTHTAEAPETDDYYATRVSAYVNHDGDTIITFEVLIGGQWRAVLRGILASGDWTIRNKHGRKVRFRKRTPVSLLQWGQALEYMHKHPRAILVDSAGDEHMVSDSGIRYLRFAKFGEKRWHISHRQWGYLRFRVTGRVAKS